MNYHVFSSHAALLKALAHPKRLEILHLLRESEFTVGSMQTMLHMPQANLSQHLHVLRRAGIVQTRRHGKLLYYALAHPNFIKASDLIREVLLQRSADGLPGVTRDGIQDLPPLVTDPVCGMRISPRLAPFGVSHEEAMYFFCGSGCYETFRNNLEDYKWTNTYE